MAQYKETDAQKTAVAPDSVGTTAAANTASDADVSAALDAVMNGKGVEGTEDDSHEESQIEAGIETAQTEEGTEDAQAEIESKAKDESGSVATEEDSTAETSDTSMKKRVNHIYGCIIRPSNDVYLTEAAVAMAWKEFSNMNSDARIIRLTAQAVDPSSGEIIGTPIEIEIIPNDITHGSVPGRTIGFSGYLATKASIPNWNNGGINPQDTVGWNEDHIWVSVVFDTYDQVGRIDSYANSISGYKLATVKPSTALNLSPLPTTVF